MKWLNNVARFRIKIRGKPHDTGLKLLLMADEKWIPYDFWMYRGKQTDILQVVHILQNLTNFRHVFRCS